MTAQCNGGANRTTSDGGDTQAPVFVTVAELRDTIARLRESERRLRAVTARACRRRQQREQALLRELDHRSRNLLSIVQAIAHSTAAGNPTEFLARFSARVQALAVNQDLLVRNRWRGVDIGDLVGAHAAAFADAAARITAHGPGLRLNPAASQAIGLAIHELATNACEHGALTRPHGAVEVAWELAGDNLAIAWRERGGPALRPPLRRGFGTTVLETMVPRTVGGAVDLDYRSSGVTWRLTCPLATVRDPPDPDGGERRC